MKFHEGTCTDTPCRQIHRYHCANCDTLFDASIETQALSPSGLIQPTLLWPACSPPCADDLYREYHDHYIPMDENPISDYDNPTAEGALS